MLHVNLLQATEVQYKQTCTYQVVFVSHQCTRSQRTIYSLTLGHSVHSVQSDITHSPTQAILHVCSL